MKRTLCSLLVAALPFGSAFAMTLVYQHKLCRMKAHVCLWPF